VGWLSARGVRSGSALAVAHVGVEVLLDAALAGDEYASKPIERRWKVRAR